MALTDVGSERAILAGIFQYGIDAWVDVADFVNINCFSNSNNQMIYKTLDNLFSNGMKNVDVPSFISKASELGYKEAVCNNEESIKYLRSLVNMQIHKENIRKHAKKLMNLFVAKEAQKRHQEAYQNLENITGAEGIDKILSLSEEPIINLSHELQVGKDDKPDLLGSNIEDYLHELAANPIENMGVPTPWPILNKLIGGGLRTGVCLFAARPKVGKTTIGKITALHVSRKLKIPVLMLDTEMQKEDQVHRTIAELSGVDIGKIETGKFINNDREAAAVFAAAKEIKQIKYYHKRIGGKNFDEVLSIIRRWIFTEVGFAPDGTANPHLVIYDYFKLMSSDSLKDMQEYQAIGFQVSKMVDFCNEYKTPVMAFVQINRDGLTKDTSDVISQSDRLLWLCNAAILYKRKTAEEMASDINGGNMKFIVLEARFGTPLDEGDWIDMVMDGSKSTLKEIGTRHSRVKKKDDVFDRKQSDEEYDED